MKVVDFEPPSMLSCSTNDDGVRIRQRRMAQNRASQRAFRERKRSHFEEIEAKLHNLHKMHDDLQKTYKRQAEQVFNLMTYIGELKLEITTMQTSPGLLEMPKNIDTETPVKPEASPQYFFSQTGSGYTSQYISPPGWDMRYPEAGFANAFGTHDPSGRSSFYEHSTSRPDMFWS